MKISMQMKLKDGKSKVLTLSYDDGVVQDKQFLGILDRNGLKCTFNINTGRYADEDAAREQYTGRMKLSEAKALYLNSGHEVAAHSLTHPSLTRLTEAQVLLELLEDRKNIETEFGTLARGMAYPNGVYNKMVLKSVRACGICYSRTTESTEGFDFPEDWVTWHPTCHHNNPKLMTLAKQFIEETPKAPIRNWLFYLWGHSYEFDRDNNWDLIEQFASYVGGKEDVWYATNIEICDYVKAYESLQISVDGNIIRNPSATDVWFTHCNRIYCIHGGETLNVSQ